MCDSGNSFGPCISETLFKQLGVELEPLPNQLYVATAQKGSHMRVLGRTKDPITFTLGNCPEKFTVKPFVIPGLSMDLNLSKGFMEENNIDELHSSNTLRVRGHDIPLGTPVSTSVNPVAVAYVKEEVSIKAGETGRVPLEMPDWGDGEPGQRLHMECDPTFFFRTGCLNERSRMKTLDAKGVLHGEIMNITETTVTFPQGLRFGEVVSCPQEQVSAMSGGRLPSEGEIRSHIRNGFGLNGPNSVLTRSEDRQRAEDLIFEYRDLFAWDGQPGRTHLIQHRIPLKKGTAPIFVRTRAMNPSMEEGFKEQLLQWLRTGVIKETSSPYNAGIVVVPKKTAPGDPPKFRYCLDFRVLNDHTIKDRYYIGSCDSNLAKLEASKVFSTLDGFSAYHSVPIYGPDQEKTAFSSPLGSFKFQYMPFGLCGAPATYARLMDIVLKGLTSTAIPFLDDVLVYTPNLEVHFQSLRDTFEAHRRAGLRLQMDKCKFFQSEVEYLGHKVNAAGTQPMPSLVEMIKTWPVPTNRYEARVFIGKVSYYRRFIKNFAQIAKPLLDRLAQNGKGDLVTFGNDPSILACTNALKEAIEKAPILAHPQFRSKEPFIVDTDFSASNRAIGACLSQKQDGIERPIAMAAKRLTKSQRSYSAFKGELCSVLHFLNHWQFYLLGRPFILRVDSRALKWIHTLDSPTGMVERWLLTLSKYDFQVEHRLSHQHGNADGLSRAPHLPAPDGSTMDVESEGVNSVRPPDSSEVWDTSLWVETQKGDDDLLPIIRALKSGKKPEIEELRSFSSTCQLYFGHYEDLYLDSNSILCYKRSLNPELSNPRKTPVYIVPRVWWTDAMKKVHEGAGHCGVQNTVERAARSLYFVGMGRVGGYVVRSCEICQAKRPKEKDQRHTYQPVLSGYPFMRVCIDYVGPLPISHRGNRYILTVLDTFTRWLEAFPVKTNTAENAVHKLTTEVFPRHGIPQAIHSDQGSHFTANLTYSVANILGIRLTHTPAYNPKSNSVERAHLTLGRMLTSLCNRNQSKWETYLPQALFAMRTQRSRITNTTPFKMLFGREASYPLDLLFAVPHPDPSEYIDHEEYALALQNRVECAHSWARKHIATAIERQRRAYHQDQVQYHPGDRVWLYTPRIPPGTSSKFWTYWTGPWWVQKAHNSVTYTILPDPSWIRKKPETVSIDRLKRYYESERGGKMQPPPADADLRMVGDEFGETIPHEAEDTEFTTGPEVEHPQREPVAGNPPGEPQPEEVPAPPPAEPLPVAGPAKPGPRNLAKRAQRLTDEAERVYGTLPDKRRRSNVE